MEYKESNLITAKSSGSGSGSGYQVSGYLTRWGEIDAYGDITVKGSFAKCIQEHPTLPLLWAHKMDALPLGVVRGWNEDNTGVFFIAQIAPTSAGEDVKRLLDTLGSGSVGLMGVSYGYNPEKFDYKTIDGIRCRRLLVVSAVEASLTPFPALKSAHLLSASAKDELAIGLYECSKACGLPVTAKMMLDYMGAIERQERRRKAKLAEIELYQAELEMLG